MPEPGSGKLALQAGTNVLTTCCKRDDHICEQYHSCGYQRQFEREAQVYIGAHQLLFHELKQIGKVDAAVVDEGFWQAGIEIWKHGVPIDDLPQLSSSGTSKHTYIYDPKLDQIRRTLAEVLRRQPENGSIERKHLEGLTAEMCVEAASLEFKAVRYVELYPGMTKTELRVAESRASSFRWALRMRLIWETLKELLEGDKDATGRLYIEKGCIKYRGVMPVRKQWQVPTLIGCDAA